MPTSLVAIRLADPTQTVAALDEIWAAGDAALPLDPHAPDAVVADRLRRLRPAALIHPRPDGRRKVTRLDGGAPVPDGTAVVVATSGSTGDPHGIVLSHDALDASARASVIRLGCRQGQQWWLNLPLHHVAGLQVVRRSRLLGTEPVIGSEQATTVPGEADWLALVPTQLERLVRADTDLHGIGVLLGGAAAPPGLIGRARERGATVTRSYGMTETCGGCVYDGLPLDGVDVAVGDDGRIRLRGPMVATGRREPDGSIAPIVDGDGWLVTSDLGELDDTGRLTVLGRADNVVVTGGENVAVEAVEAALKRHPSVADAAVFAEPDPEWGQLVVAAVVPADGAEPQLETLRRHVAGELGRHAAPKRIDVVGALPRTTLGKLDRTRLGSDGA